MDEQGLRLIGEALQRHFTIEQLETLGLLDNPPTRELRRQLADIDMQFFCQYYLREHFNKALAPMQEELSSEMTEVINADGKWAGVVAWPRGHGKTSWITLGAPAWSICLGKSRHILLIMDSQNQAKEQLTTLKTELENNDRIHEDFGNFRKGAKKWQEDDITTSNDVKVVALGTGMKIRGRKFSQWRPDLIILDDPEELDAVKSKTRRRETAEWFRRSVMRAGMEDTKVFVVGNYIHFECLTKQLASNPMFVSRKYKAVVSFAERQDLWETWRLLLIDLSDPNKDKTARAFFEANKEEMLEGVEVAWPEGHSYYELMVIKVSEGDSAFAMELQNDPLDPEKRVFNHWATFGQEVVLNEDGMPIIWLVPRNGRPRIRLIDCALFAMTDPSLGKDYSSDPSAIIIIAKSPLGQGFILEVDKRRRPPDQIMTDQIRWAEQYPITRWGIEAVQFQAFFASQSGKESMAAGEYLRIVPIQQSHRGGKEMRIQSLQPDFENEYLLLSENGQQSLLSEMDEFGAGSTEDDALDALEGAWRLAQLWQSIQTTESAQGETFTYAVKKHTSLPVRPLDPFADREKLATQTIFEHRVQLLISAHERGEFSEVEFERRWDELQEEHKREEQEAWFPITVM